MLFPNHNYEQSLSVVVMYRPPDAKHPPYEEALEEVTRSQGTENRTAIIAGDLNINSWGKEYHEWIEREDLRVLTDPLKATHRSGAPDDTMLVAVGDYIPEGIPPGEAETDTESEKAEFYPVFVTEDLMIADHMAFLLALQTEQLTGGLHDRK